MKTPSDVCACGSPVSAEEERKGGLCPVCGKRMKKVEALSDSLIEATFEILAEEGAIWSGAR
jgi:Zn finger protein HypA/HybF involved in hydrogenase expression